MEFTLPTLVALGDSGEADTWRVIRCCDLEELLSFLEPGVSNKVVERGLDVENMLCVQRKVNYVAG